MAADTQGPVPAGGAPSGGEEGRRRRLFTPVGGLVVLLVVLLAVFAGALVWLRPASPGEQISLDALDAAAKGERVVAAEFLDEDARITGTLQTADGQRQRFWASYPQSDATTNELFQTLVAGGAQVSVDAQPVKAQVRFATQFLVPLLILATMFGLVFAVVRDRGGGDATSGYRAFGRMGKRRVEGADRPTTTFADVAAVREAVPELAEVRDYLADPSAYAAMGALPPKGVLLVGPPGCGKTLLARAVAGEASVPFYSLSGSEFVESLVGVGAARVRDLFAQVRASAPAILFIDELDGLGRRRGAGVGGGHDEREQTLNELLVQLDGFAADVGVVVMGATNRPDMLDPALLRPGRFGRHVTIDRPDPEGRAEILALHAAGRRLVDPDTDLAAIAQQTSGFTGADLANVVNEAALLAVRERAEGVTRAHLEEAVDRVVAGPRRKGYVLPDEDKQHLAYHEAGHAVVAAALGHADTLGKISIIARGSKLGHTAVPDDNGHPILTRAAMQARITIAMAGVAAEEHALGQPSTGSEDDLRRATNTARDMAGRYGMSPGIGRMRVLTEADEVFLGRDYLASQELSQPTLEELDREVRVILDTQEQLAATILATNDDTLEHVAAALWEHETLHDADLRGILEALTPFDVEALPAASGTAERQSTRQSRGGGKATSQQSKSSGKRASSGTKSRTNNSRSGNQSKSSGGTTR